MLGITEVVIFFFFSMIKFAETCRKTISFFPVSSAKKLKLLENYILKDQATDLCMLTVYDVYLYTYCMLINMFCPLVCQTLW